MSKRTIDGGIKSRSSRIPRSSAMSDNTGGDAGNGGHEETQLDPIAQGWKIYRGPPDYTHATLPWIYEQKLTATEYSRDYTIRLTSPYDPLHDGTSADANPGTGFADTVTASASDTKNNFGRNVAYWDYYASLYKYYSVLGCRYRVRVENLSHEKFYVHAMHVTNTTPPATASNWDMLIWKGVKSKLVHPYMKFTNLGVAYTNYVNQVEEEVVQMDADAMNDPSEINNENTETHVISNKTGSTFAYFQGEYRPGQSDQMIHEDDAVSIWTPVTANPTLREALLIRIKPYDNATVTSSTSDYERELTYNITIECDYLVEFKELPDTLRWPVTRNPLSVTINSTATSPGTA